MITVTTTTLLDTLIRDLASYVHTHLSVQASVKGTDHTATLSLARPLPYAEEEKMVRHFLGYIGLAGIANDDAGMVWEFLLEGKG